MVYIIKYICVQEQALGKLTRHLQLWLPGQWDIIYQWTNARMRKLLLK